MPVKDEIGEMLKTIGGGSASTDAPSTNAPGTESPGTGAPGTDAPGTAAPGTDAPATEGPATEVPDEKDTIISDLRKKLDAVEKKEPVKEIVPTAPEPLVLEAQDFIGDLDPYEVVQDKDAFNKLLNIIYQKGVNEARNITSEGVLRSIPDIVRFNINLTNELKKSSDAFYDRHKDLAPFKRVVATVFEEIASKNPDKKPDDILEDVAKEARSRLELHKKTTVPDNNSDRHPRLPGKKGASGKPTDQPKVTAIESELAEMNKVIGR